MNDPDQAEGAPTGTRRGPPRIDKITRRRAIMIAGRDLLREDGFRALHMRAVARRAGVALGTVYLYFATKEELYAALYAERLDEMFTALAPALRSRPDPEDFFVEFMSDYRRLHAEFGRELDLFTAAGTAGAVDPAVLESLADSTTRLLGGMRTMLTDHGVDRPDLALTLLWSTATGLAEHFGGPRRAWHTPDWDAAVRYAAEKLASALLPPPE